MKGCLHFAFSCLILLSGCTFLKNAFHACSSEEKKLEQNGQYAALLFQKEAPEVQASPLEDRQETGYTLAALDSLFVEQMQSDMNLEELSTTISQLINKKASYEAILPSDIKQMAMKARSHAITSSICLDKNRLLFLEVSTPLDGHACQTAYVYSFVRNIHLKKLLFPSLIGIAVTRQPNPLLFLLSSTENGTPYPALFSSSTLKKDTLEKACQLLGEALGEAHTVFTPRHAPLPPSWHDSISKLIDTFSHRYLGVDPSLHEASQTITDCLLTLLSHYEKRQKTFHTGLALGNTDLSNFMLSTHETVLLIDPSTIGGSLSSLQEIKPVGLLAYDYCRMWHDLLLTAAPSCTKIEVRHLLHCFEMGYRRSRQPIPSSDEWLFFVLLDLIRRIESSHHDMLASQKETSHLSFLESELLQWSKTVCEIRKKR